MENKDIMKGLNELIEEAEGITEADEEEKILRASRQIKEICEGLR